MNTFKITRAFVCAFVLGCAALLAMPAYSAADTTSRLGGGNALLRASTGITNTNIASDILSRLTFASIQGGQPEDVPPANEGEEQSGTEPNESANQNATPGNGTNGGVFGASGGNGGDGGPSGLTRSGNVISNSTAINAINTTIIRIGR